MLYDRLCPPHNPGTSSPMLQKIKDFLSSGGHIDTANDAPHDDHENRIACAALMIEAAHLDGEQDGVEEATIRTLIKERFELSDDETDSLFEAAHARQQDAVELHQFTHQIKSSFTEEERIHLVEMMWEVVYADGELHAFEDQLMRRIGGLIHVSDRARGDARKRVLEKLGLTS